MFSKILRRQRHVPLCISLDIFLALMDFLELKMVTHSYLVQDVGSVILYKGQDLLFLMPSLKRLSILLVTLDKENVYTFLAVYDDSRSYA